MPALDDHIDELFETYFYHVTTPQNWQKIRHEGLKPDHNGVICALSTNRRDIVDRFAAQLTDADKIVVVRFNPCNLGLYPEKVSSDCDGSVESYLFRIKANVIGPLLLEKDEERKIEK